MADLKTHLRELSFGVTVGLECRGIDYNLEDLYCGSTFYKYATDLIDNDVSSASNIADTARFTQEYQEIIANGNKLGIAVCKNKNFTIDAKCKIKWLGNDTQKGDPIDVEVGQYKFSLKEDSFILKNMGLYNLLNSLTGSAYERGLHVFNTFARTEYDAWFAYSWKLLNSYLDSHKCWILRKGADISTIRKENGCVELKFNHERCLVPTNINTNTGYMQRTSAIIREKVFSKWVKTVANTDAQYIKLKKLCSSAAGAALEKIINDNYSPDNLKDFFQIFDFDYYYGKSTSTETTILKVPSLTNFSSMIEFQGCKFEVPNSQLNIYTTFINKKTQVKLQFRNECRFSHGQFNGTPEAKMYVVRDTPLYQLYEPI